MKNVRSIGFFVFLAGILLFTANIFLGSYKITPDLVRNHFDSTPEMIDAGDTIANTFIEASTIYSVENRSPYSDVISFNAALPKIIAIHNGLVRDLVYDDEAISEADLSSIYSFAVENDAVHFSEEKIRSGLGSQEAKIKMLVDNTSWMYSASKSYTSVDEFKGLLNNKVTELNQGIGGTYRLHDDGGSLLALNKVFISSPANSNTLIWLFLTFGLAVIGSIAYNLANIKLLGPAGIKNDGIYRDAISSRGWIAWVVMFYLVTFYVFLYFYPQYLVNNIILVNPVSQLLSGNPASQWFLYGFMYCVAMTVMAVRMWVKYRHDVYQIVRTTVVLFFQIAFAFIIPELLVRFNMPYYDFKNAWPLDYDYFFSGNIENLMASGNVGMFMLFWGIILTALIVPIMVYFFGKRWYCSWVCGCGGLAETLGDPYRQLSNKKMWAWKVERWLIHGVLVFAILMTALTLYSFASGATSMLGVQTYTVQKTYGFLIGSIFSGVIGTGFYPIFGNRTWCRFGCPLAAYLGFVQRFKSRFRITTNGGQCISCGNCSTYCEQGIDVRAYAQKGQNIIRSSCVGCGICSAVCPRGVLKLENGPEAGRFGNEGPIVLGNNGFKLNN
jgi:Pyruvate/2-oxoacid:ferredoxin oxidoreductase delta subunit